MKYKLKRDLPFAKAGKEVFEDDASFYIEAEVGIIWCFAEIKDRHKLISEGWIEEVKPREWVINIGDDGAAIFKDGKMLFKFGRVDTPVIEKIKVRECLDE